MFSVPPQTGETARRSSADSFRRMHITGDAPVERLEALKAHANEKMWERLSARDEYKLLLQNLKEQEDKNDFNIDKDLYKRYIEEVSDKIEDLNRRSNEWEKTHSAIQESALKMKEKKAERTVNYRA